MHFRWGETEFGVINSVSKNLSQKVVEKFASCLICDLKWDVIFWKVNMQSLFYYSRRELNKWIQSRVILWTGKEVRTSAAGCGVVHVLIYFSHRSFQRRVFNKKKKIKNQVDFFSLWEKVLGEIHTVPVPALTPPRMQDFSGERTTRDLQSIRKSFPVTIPSLPEPA